MSALSGSARERERRDIELRSIRDTAYATRVPVRILQVSDLHVGAHDDGRTDVENAIGALVTDEQPELVIATGDLTHRNRADQHMRAGEFLRALGPPVVAVPGNHDLPAFPPRRQLSPFAAFLGVWGETEPVYRSPGAVVCCLNSVRPWRYQRGALSSAQLERVQAVLAEAPPDALRVVALHHHLTSAPWRSGKRTIPSRSRTLARLASSGAELVLGGHTHQSVVVERREFQHAPGGVVLATAPGAGRPRPGRHAEAAGVHVYDADRATLRVRTLAWVEGELTVVADRVFPRG
jgi:3',5'-cyclic AMP phosphodiesterase CpdA